MQRFDADGQPATTTDHPVCLEDNLFLRKTSSHDAGPTNDELLSRSGQQVLISPLDHRFQGHVVVGEAEFEWLSGAYSYGAVSTVPGVITALKTLKARIRRGETISLFEPDTMYQLEARGIVIAWGAVRAGKAHRAEAESGDGQLAEFARLHEVPPWETGAARQARPPCLPIRPG